MKTVWLYRVAALLLLLFAAAHTYGFLNFRPPTPEGVAVMESMKRVHFVLDGEEFSYGAFYVGFGLFVTLYLLFSAFLAWWLGELSVKAPAAVVSLGWVFFGVQVVSVGLSWAYFSTAPTVSSALVAVCLGCGAMKCSHSRATTS